MYIFYLYIVEMAYYPMAEVLVRNAVPGGITAEGTLTDVEKEILKWINTKVTPKVITEADFLKHKENEDFFGKIEAIKTIAIDADEVNAALTSNKSIADPILAIVKAAKGGARRNNRRSTRQQNRRSRNNRRSTRRNRKQSRRSNRRNRN